MFVDITYYFSRTVIDPLFQAEKNKEKSSKENGGQTGTFDSGATDGGGGVGEGQNGGGGGFEETALQLHNLSTQLDVAEQSQAQLSQV